MKSEIVYSFASAHKNFSQQSYLVSSLILSIFLPVPLSQGVITSSSLDLYYSEDDRSNIPIALPIVINRNVNVNDVATSSNGNQGVVIYFSALSSCGDVSVSSVDASGNDANVPSNVIANNLNPRWSNLGTGFWIQPDLGSRAG